MNIFIKHILTALVVITGSNVSSPLLAYTTSDLFEGDYTNGQGRVYSGDGLTSWIDGKPYTDWVDPSDPEKGPSWIYERQRRERAIEAYLGENRHELASAWGFRQEGTLPQNPGLAWKWFQESPVGFGGVPYVLLKTVIDLDDTNCALEGKYNLCALVGVWQKSPSVSTGLAEGARNLDHLGFGPHPDDYDDNGAALDPVDRQWPLPYGFVFQSGNPKSAGEVAPYAETIDTLNDSTYQSGIIESWQIRTLKTGNVEDNISKLDKHLKRKFRLGKISLGLSKLKGSFKQKNVLGLYKKGSNSTSSLASYYEDDATEFGRSTGLDRVFFSCAACHVGRVYTQDRGIQHLYGAPNTEVQAQYFSELLMITGGALVSSGFDIDSPTMMNPNNFEVDTDLITGLFKAMLYKAINHPKTLYGSSPEQILRGKYMAFRVAWNFPEVIKDLIGTAVKTHFVYRVVAGNNAYNPHNTLYALNPPLPDLMNGRIGAMDAFGMASGLVAIHTLRPDASFMKFLHDDPHNTLGDGSGNSSVFAGFKGPDYLSDDPRQLGADLRSLDIEQQLKVAGQRVIDPMNMVKWAPPLAAPVDIKSMFFSRDRALANWDGNQAASARALASGTSATGDPRKVNVEIHEPLNPFINHLPPSPYVWDIDLDKAAKGRQIYQKNCAGCHKPGMDRIFSAKKLDVDPNRSLTNTAVSREMLAGLVLEACNIYVQNNSGKPGSDFCLPEGDSQAERLEDYFADVPARVAAGKNGYKADMLHGIWTRAPYLHNGSVPTLAALMCVSARPVKFLRGVLNYDTELVGFEWLDAPRDRYNSIHEVVSFEEYDTQDISRSNTGHDYANFLCPKELDALDPIKDRARMTELMLGKDRDTDLAHLLEYLKTL